jgi:Iap family predicted aminopeptidase
VKGVEDDKLKAIMNEKEIIYFKRRGLETVIATNPETGSAIVFNREKKNGLLLRRIIVKLFMTIILIQYQKRKRKIYFKIYRPAISWMKLIIFLLEYVKRCMKMINTP